MFVIVLIDCFLDSSLEVFILMVPGMVDLETVKKLFKIVFEES